MKKLAISILVIVLVRRIVVLNSELEQAQESHHKTIDLLMEKDVEVNRARIENLRASYQYKPSRGLIASMIFFVLSPLIGIGLVWLIIRISL